MKNLWIYLTKYVQDFFTANYIILLREILEDQKKERIAIQCSWIEPFSNKIFSAPQIS